MAFLDTSTPTGSGLNYFSYSPQVKALLSQLGTQAQNLTRYPLGMSDAENQAAINQLVEKVRSGAAPDIEAMRLQAARQGLLGSGLETTREDAAARAVNQNVAAARSNYAVQTAQNRASNTVAGLNAAQGIAGTLMGGQTAEEAANAARRNEGRSDTQTLLSYLGMLYGNQATEMQPYIQAILNQNQANTYGTGNLSWLAYLPYLMGGK